MAVPVYPDQSWSWIYSFNDSRIVSGGDWGGFSLRWYAALLDNRQLIEAALLSLRIAFTSATFATALGWCWPVLPWRASARFRGRILFSGMINAAPLVMPEVITGLSLLLLFVSLQDYSSAGRGDGAP